jgi:hypothetical protein
VATGKKYNNPITTRVSAGKLMDCYIIRVYRHITGDDGESDEIAGLVEPVGKRGTGKPFSSYKSMVNALRDELSGAADRKLHGRETKPDLQVVQTFGKTTK